ncbi:MAG: ATP-binding protein [Rhodoferax sp.]
MASKAFRRFVAVGASATVATGLVLLYLLAQATDNRQLFEQHYARLFMANVVVASLMLVGVVWLGWKLGQRLRQRRFGSRLLAKLALTFGVVGVVPGLIIYGVSYQFVSRSIESWFEARVQGALEAGLSLGRVSLDTLAQDLVHKAALAAAPLGQVERSSYALHMERLLDQLGAEEVSLWSASGKLLAAAGNFQLRLTPEPPTAAQLRNARANGTWVALEGLEDREAVSAQGARVRVVLALESSALGLNPEQRFFQVVRALPATLVSNALAVESVSREYQERALSLQGLKRMYIGTLTLGLFLAVFGALLLAVVLGNQIAQPLLVLAEGVEQVAAGDLTPKPVWAGSDELGGLTRAFASMTGQLAEARQSAQRSLAEVSAARIQLQTILDKLTAGVLVLGADMALHNANPGAARILGVPLVPGQDLSALGGVEVLAHTVQQQFSAMAGAPSGAPHWQATVQLGSSDGADRASPFARITTLVLRGALLPDGQRLVVFDDITEVVSAQRAQAWGEVARRLAHEIKNPLTPIQLSAERLERRLLPKLAPEDKPMLEKAVRTVVDQVDAMKRLVNEFRDFARLPNADLRALDLNALVAEVMGLYDSDSSFGGVQVALDPECPPILGDPQQLRQVVHNLLQNAQEAAEALDPAACRITLQTRWSDSAGKVRLTVMDNGPGFPDHIVRRAFEPYVTTKQRGTGLGLAVVKKIADDHHARIDLGNRSEGGRVAGAVVSLSFDPARDQIDNAS